MMLAGVKEITKDDLLEEVQKLAGENWRLISITGTDTGSGIDLIYHFDQELTLLNLRFQIDYGETIPSITPYYFCAFVPENELKDFLGVEVTNLPVDYQHLFIISELTPVKIPLLRKAAGDDAGEVKPE
ncbi:MAG: NADH-quinone oxidoreductase subunit C [Firmicutes bacterium]|nr:NADH-quinone oxidoreductase subunit C [Bacillota bacterium]